ncbi:hypothetical protein J2X61_004922 [Bacillus sp. 3255]|nr:hypothetical protein [Bacillus sp. 3255]
MTSQEKHPAFTIYQFCFRYKNKSFETTFNASLNELKEHLMWAENQLATK